MRVSVCGSLREKVCVCICVGGGGRGLKEGKDDLWVRVCVLGLERVGERSVLG